MYVLDLCDPLLEVARRRVRTNGWTEKVRPVLGDACDESLLGAPDGLPAPGSVDVVTFSYSLTMIPDWRAALEVAFMMRVWCDAARRRSAPRWIHRHR